MATITVQNIKGENVGEVNLDENVFDGKINKALLHQVILMYRANKRKGTASTKTRAKVSGGGRKPWRQKGTGRARVGSIRSPLWRGGGIVFGPHPRNYSYTLPKKIRRRALKDSLNAKFKSGQLIVIDELKVDEPKTKKFMSILSNINIKDKTLVLMRDLDENVIKSSNNIQGLMLRRLDNFSAYDVLSHRNLIITKDGLDILTNMFKEKKSERSV